MKKNKPPKALFSQSHLFLPLAHSFFPKPSHPLPSKLTNKAYRNNPKKLQSTSEKNIRIYNWGRVKGQGNINNLLKY